MKNTIFVLIATLLLLSCKSGRIATTETKPTETIIFGKLTINSEKEINYKDIWIHFNERLWGKNITRLDEKGYFSVKLPLGHNDIAMLVYGRKNKNIPKDYVSIDVEDSNTIYYVGDIVIGWKPSNKDRGNQWAGALGGITGALVSANAKGDELPVKVTESNSTIQYFEQKFPENKKKIKTQLVIFNKTLEE